MGSDDPGVRHGAAQRYRAWAATRPLRVAAAAAAAIALVVLLARRSSTRVDSVLHSLSAPAPLPVGAEITEGVHILPADQRLGYRLGLGGAAAHACRAGSAAGTAGWSDDEWVAAVATAAEFMRNANATIARLAAIPLDRPALWYDEMPRMQECASLMRYGGTTDGGKWLCSLEALTPPCVIYSVGSYGDFKFEDAMVAATQCEIFSFDCFVPPERVPTFLHPRIHFEPVCVGADSADGRFQSLSTLTRQRGHASLSLLKFDVEGAEFGLLEHVHATAMARFSSSYAYLPSQLSFEVHLHQMDSDPLKRAAGLVEYFQRLLDLGYVPVSRELNSLCPHCEEFVFLRLAAECWAGLPADSDARAPVP